MEPNFWLPTPEPTPQVIGFELEIAIDWNGKVRPECSINKNRRARVARAGMHIDNESFNRLQTSLGQRGFRIGHHADVAESRGGDILGTALVINKKSHHEDILANVDRVMLHIVRRNKQPDRDVRDI